MLRVRSVRLTKSFTEFFEGEKSSAVALIVCTAMSLAIANSPVGEEYLGFLHSELGGLSVELWVNDGLMAIFFLLIGLELERELYGGELSSVKRALLPIVAAIGGIITPAAIHYTLNVGTPAQPGMGIPMATDIAFAIGVLALLSSRVPASLKVFLTAFAVMDDLGAIIVIAVFYTSSLSFLYLMLALGVFAMLLAMNRMRVASLVPYIAGGAVMWFFMLKSGVHATISGVLLAFTIPFSQVADDERSPSYRLEHFLHKPVAFLILPIFALANTGIVIGTDWAAELESANSMGIFFGLVVGKPIGITILSFLAVTIGICRLPLDLNWKHIFGAGLLGGIGFTMSIFITNLAFSGDGRIIDASKMAILLASMTAGTVGFLWLKYLGHPEKEDSDLDTIDFEEEHEDEAEQ